MIDAVFIKQLNSVRKELLHLRLKALTYQRIAKSNSRLDQIAFANRRLERLDEALADIDLEIARWTGGASADAAKKA